MQLANSEALSWFLVLIPCVIAAIGYGIWKRRMTRALGHAPMIAAMVSEVSRVRQISAAIMTCLGLALMIMALVQPQWGQTDHLVKRSGIDVVFALDLSRSMLARDVAPSRLDAAKKEIATALEQLAGDRAGLVVFTSVSFAQSPLTNDYGALRFYLRKLDPKQMPFGGTSLGRAISDGVDLLSGQSDGENTQKIKRAKNQIIVLITDGEDHESDPYAAARQANAERIHIVTVGFGSTKGERIPTFNDDGTISGFTRDRKGDIVYSKLDDGALKKLASETQGIYIPYNGENSVAYALVDYINALEKSELEAMMKQRYEERFFWFLTPGLLLILIGFLLGDRRSPGRKRVGKGGEGPATRHLLTSLVLLALLAPFASGCDELLIREVDEVKQGNTLIEQGDYTNALAAYEEATKLLPPSPELSYNMGRARMGIPEDLAAAQEAFARALETEDPHLRFDALYNLGLVLATQEKWKDAYETFQQALLAYANSSEWRTQPQYIDAIFNMEVAWQKLFPPCSTLEDDFEENDTPEQATALQELKAEDRVLCGGDDDLHVIPVVPGTRLTVRATFEDLRDVLDPERPFLPRPEDLQIALFNRAGAQVLAVDQGAREAGDESANVTTFTSPKGQRSRVKRQLLDIVITEEMLGPQGSEVLLKIKASDEREFSYSFEIEAIPPCVALDDQFEQNETRATAKPLPAEPQTLHICPGNEDWFSITVAKGETLFVDLQAGEDIERKAPTEASFEVYNARGDVVATGTPDAGFLTAGLWESLEDTTYAIRVFHPEQDAQGPYTLSTYRYGACPTSDDRFEENDDAQTATKIDAQVPVQRYVRVCEGDLDFYMMPLPEPEKKEDDDKTAAIAPPTTPPDAPEPRKLSVSLTPVYRDGIPPEPAVVQQEKAPVEGQPEPLSDTALSFVLMDLTGNRVLLEAVLPDAVDAPRDTPENERLANLAAQTLILTTELPAEQALLRVKGPATFYHLTQLNPSSSDQQQDEEQENDEENKGDGSESENEDDQKNEDSKPEESDPKDEGEEGKEDGEKKDDQEPEQKDKQGEQPDEKKGEESPEPGEMSDEAPQNAEMQRVEDILRALEDSDDNFQMRKALENTPGRYIEKDW